MLQNVSIIFSMTVLTFYLRLYKFKISHIKGPPTLQFTSKIHTWQCLVDPGEHEKLG
jgi:hypothetical protein